MNSVQSAMGQNKIIRIPPLDYTPEPGGMGKTFYTKMLNHGNAVAQIDGLTGEKDTYANLLKRCIRTAVVMRSKGIQKGDIVTTCSYNHFNSSVPFIASQFLGAVPASLDPTISLTDTTHLLKQVNPKSIFVVPEAVELIESSLRGLGSDTEIVVFGDSTKHTQFSEFLKETPEEASFVPIEISNLKETAIIFFSSGTTGLPKGICSNHLGTLSHAHQFIELGFNTERLLVFSSLYWISAVQILTISILRGTSRIIVPRFNVDTVWDLIADRKVSMMFAAPSQAIAMYKRGRPNSKYFSYLSQILIGGGAMAADLLAALRELLPKTQIALGYAQTELTGGTLGFAPKRQGDFALAHQKPESSGRPLYGMIYKIVNPDTEEVLGPNQNGELRVKSEFQMNGYYKMDSSSTLDGEGFIKTGDIAYYDEDYCFYIVDRIKEMLKFQSWHVPPAKLEGVLSTHPAVENAVVIGLPHPEDGDHPMGLVVLKNGFAGRIEAKEIEKYANERILDDKHKLRGGVKIIQQIPLTATGKLKRNELRDMVIQGKL